MNTGRYNLWQLLNNNEIEQIIIPEIQRDYVWKKDNVEALFHSILINYREKSNIHLDIKNGENAINGDIRAYLSKEYSKLRYSTQIGFIYAYHDMEYAGKFFLIDGQQRITTLYLLLLAIYKKAGKQENFRKLYFKNNRLKLDYKVREVSHDFMQQFVEYILDHSDNHFENSGHYYKQLYTTDKTTTTITANFNTLLSLLDSEHQNRPIPYDDFIDYIENYIEFNYFDTNLSEQGEQLYLYMNSRGESLSFQEIVKTSILKRADGKQLEAGRKWEEWQNFFWRHRGLNPNADKGFEEFLKWATIIHISTNKETDITLKQPEEKQTTTEVKEEYIKALADSKLLKQYQQENKTFDIAFLNKLFTALQYLESSKSNRFTEKNMLESPYFREEWLSQIKNQLDYVTICGVLFYLSKYGDTVSTEDVDRLGMYLKNLCFYRTNVDAPSRVVIRALEAIQALIDAGHKDIIHLENIPKISPRIYREADKNILQCYHQSDREEWENAIWSIANHNDFARFLNGDYTFFFKCSADDSGNYDVREFSRYKDCFENRIYKVKDGDDLRRQLLRVDDICVYDGWSSIFGFNRWNILKNDERVWQKLLIDKKQAIQTFLNQKQDREAIAIPTDWREPFIREPRVLSYMEKKMFLWQDETRYILLKGQQANHYNSREIQIQLFHIQLPLSWVYMYHTCVQEFEYIDNQIHFYQRNDNQKFFIDIQYIWKKDGGEWYIYLGHRTPKESDREKLKKVLEHLPTYQPDQWEDEGENKFKRKVPFYIDNPNLTIIQNVEGALEKFRELIPYN